MRGQRLFIRPIEASDHPAVGDFLQNHSSAPNVPACGLLGRLVGDLVAVVAMEITPEGLRIDDIVVASPLRRKWIGRAMLREAAEIAKKMDRGLLIIEDARGADEFLRRVGFESDGRMWTRRTG